MNGSVRAVTLKGGRRRWRAVADVGQAGDRRQRTATFDTKREASDWLAELRSSRRRGSYIHPSKVTVREFLETWVDGRRDLRPTTLSCYRSALAPVIRELGDRPLQLLSKPDLERLTQEMLTSGGRGGRGLSSRTLRLTLTVLSHALSDAVREGLTPRNVALLVARPAGEAQEAQTWSLAETRRFLEVAAAHRLDAAWQMSLLGLRRGEVMGLRWEDIDWENRTVSVRRARLTVDGVVLTGQPKTPRGVRTLPMQPHLMESLRRLQRRQSAERLAAGPSYALTGWVVVDECGKPPRPEIYAAWFRQLTATAGVPQIRLHDARHSWATLAHLEGIPIAVISAWLGHSTPAFTMGKYVHSQPGALREASAAMGAALTVGGRHA